VNTLDTAELVLERDDFPLLLELLHKRTGEILWTEVVELPESGNVSIRTPEPDLPKGDLTMKVTMRDGKMTYLQYFEQPTVH
jgi:hypothetical protein